MVSVLIITRNRHALLQKCLASLEAWPERTPLQVVVVLNGEDPASAAALREFALRAPWLEWKEIPESPPGAARNAGLPLLLGEWVFFIDDDARLTPGYWDRWRQVESTLPTAAAIGGTDAPPPEARGLPRAVGLALSSFLCTGPTCRRHQAGGKPERADETMLTSCNLWVRGEWFRQGLRFPEGPRRGEETVLLQELAASGGEAWLVPSLVVWHARRTRLWEVAGAAFGSGFHRTQGRGPWWTKLPAVFLALHLLAAFFPATWAGLSLAWFFPVAAMSWLVCLRARSAGCWPAVVFLHWLIPFSYGAGALWASMGGRWRK